ncbi:uncharacterized conserved small protein [Rubidibacter lacunae KORDI 51-2]|uniref:Uncharacterized conserved small protein n=1 Tax=Rubidibacter lacunae KORDI 51-2 TaxID=582515 RepID=U5DLY1_9CHRO|nr:DUF2288 family protein [Rubidibacter lacunae]ERN42671.1 uncharacterized conserved small protein [Rubidibacter lacunae KORDI 51-2]
MRDLWKALNETLEPTEWEAIAPHSRRDAVVVVSPSLDMVEVGIAIAEDNVTSVQHWIQIGAIHKPSSGQLTEWNAMPSRRFNALIVQPYVLIQELPTASG